MVVLNIEATVILTGMGMPTATDTLLPLTVVNTTGVERMVGSNFASVQEIQRNTSKERLDAFSARFRCGVMYSLV